MTGLHSIHSSSAETIYVDNCSRINIGKDVRVDLCLNKTDIASIDVHIEQGASVNFFNLVTNTSACEQNISIHVSQDAHISVFDLGLRNDKTRRKLLINLNQELASADYYALDQLFLDADKNTELTIHHRAPNTTSMQAFRGIYSGNAQSYFLGKVVVDQDAKKACANQLYKSILLSDDAKAYVKPELLIFNHDIKASHGATIGSLDQEALFYLRSRGVPLKEAQHLLINSFIKEIIDTINDSPLKTQCQELLASCVHESLRGVYDC